MIIYDDAFLAIRQGNRLDRPIGIAYRQGKGWYLYDLTIGVMDKDDDSPELICLGLGKLPVALTQDGQQIVDELLQKAGL